MEVQAAANAVHKAAHRATVIFGTIRDDELDDEVRVTIVASPSPLPISVDAEKLTEADLERLLLDVVPESDEELDVPSFLRRQSSSRNRGFFR